MADGRAFDYTQSRMCVAVVSQSFLSLVACNPLLVRSIGLHLPFPTPSPHLSPHNLNQRARRRRRSRRGRRRSAFIASGPVETGERRVRNEGSSWWAGDGCDGRVRSRCSRSRRRRGARDVPDRHAVGAAEGPVEAVNASRVDRSQCLHGAKRGAASSR